MFIGFMLAALFSVGVWEARDQRSTFAWMLEDRGPTDDERRRTLGLPLRAAAQPMAAWVVAAFFFGFGSMRIGGHSFGYASIVAGSTLLGGVLSGAIAFLLIERICRPAFARALAGVAEARPLSIGVRPRLLLTWLLGSGVPLIALAFLPYDARSADERQNIAGAVVALSVLGLVTGLATIFMASGSVADPIETVRRALARVRAGDLDVYVPVDDGGEIGLLQSGVNEMVQGLRERARLADLFGRHVGTDVATQALARGTGLVSEAARLTDLAKSRPGRVLASEGAVDRAGDEAVAWASFGTVALRGKVAPTTIFEPLDVREPASR